MNLAHAIADFIVSRARVMICSESLAGGKPCILFMDIVDFLFVAMFDSLNEKCKKKLEAIGRQYLFEPLKEAGVEVDPLGDLNTESERNLGQLIAEKFLSSSNSKLIPCA
ncbi:hypothetical protein T459_02083 [Capsicum annuum]|uniref:Uncharacterized protein n=1 Tax=Capsicum annuum TaxID=4072 RepID=A0A2G3AIY7_CAPAN|nr:hypothetical protein T459_02083 [Capsicum annuum]